MEILVQSHTNSRRCDFRCENWRGIVSMEADRWCDTVVVTGVVSIPLALDISAFVLRLCNQMLSFHAGLSGKPVEIAWLIWIVLMTSSVAHPVTLIGRVASVGMTVASAMMIETLHWKVRKIEEIVRDRLRQSDREAGRGADGGATANRL